jgi:PhnB protein
LPSAEAVTPAGSVGAQPRADWRPKSMTTKRERDKLYLILAQRPEPKTEGGDMQVQPYLNFDGRCEEALDFYRGALGAEVTMLTRFKESPDPGMLSPGCEDKVMHASFRVGEATLMASDGRCKAQPSFQGISLTLTVSDEAEAERRFAALAAGGQVQMPLTKTFFSSRFGMLADRFGVSWMVIVRT